MRRILAGLTAVVSLVAAEYHGQVTLGGLPLPGATVTATKGNLTQNAVSDPLGNYQFLDLPDGEWAFQVVKPGFSEVKQSLMVGGGLPGKSFALEMLPVDRMDTVAAEPVAAKSPFQRTDLNQSSTPAAPKTPFEATPELNQRAADGFLINGSAVNGAASPFAQSPAFGNARRGGRRLHTYALALVDSNSALNAANFSLTGQNTLKPPFNNLTGTASFGGPIRIPHLLERNGPNLTANYSRVENRLTRVQTSRMPDAAERAGDFSQNAIFDPATGQPFAGNRIPAGRISPQALSLLKYYPQPNYAGGGYNFQAPLISNSHTDNLSLMLNRTFRRRNAIIGTLALSDTRADSDNQFHFLDLTRSRGINASVGYRRTFSPRFFGNITFEFSRLSNRRAPFFAGRENISGAAGIAGNNQDAVNWGPPSLQFDHSSIAGLGDGNPSVVHNQTSAIGYTSSWNHRAHNLTFGGDLRRQQFNTVSQNNPRGTFTFNGAAAGFDFADFLLGIPDAAAIAFGNADKYLRSTQSDFYFQDDWKVIPGVTLQMGLRWEYTSPITEKYGRLVNLDVAPGYRAIAPVVATRPSGPLTGEAWPDSLIRPDHGELEPRIGIGWRPRAASSLVLRVNYGVSYNTQVYQPFANQMVQQPPLSTSFNVASTADHPLTLARGFYASSSAATNTIAVDPRFRVGQAQNWTLTVQRDLPGSLQMVALYNGIKGTHQLQAFAPNTYPAGASNPCPACPAGYVFYASNGNSTRQSGSLQLRRRLHNGMQAQGQYTWSKSIDDAAVLGGGALGAAAQNWLDLTAERGLSSFDQRHLANLNLQYTSGMGVGGGALMGGWKGRLLKDWTLVDAIVVGSGLPLTPIYSQLIPGTGIPGSVRAAYTGAPVYSAPPGYRLNPAAVSAPVAGQWGNAGRNSIIGPGQFSMNASLARAFRLSERANLSLRLDATNPLNHVVVTQLNPVVTNPLFGLPFAVNAMRAVTTNLRLTF